MLLAPLLRRSRPSPRPAVAGRAAAVLAVCCAAQFMVVLDTSVVNVALSDMRLALGLSAAGQQWVVNSYTLTFAGLLLLAGRAADLIGRRRMFVLGLVVFVASSLAGGLATDGGWLIAARAVQGVGGALLAPTSLSLLTTWFPDSQARLRALGVWSATASSAAAIGVVCGGLLTHYLGWRWVLFINVPVGAVLLVVAGVVLADDRPARLGRRLDVLGAVTMTTGLTVFVYGIVSTATNPWLSARTIVTLTLGAVLLGAFVLVEALVARDPLVPLRIFRRRPVVVANCVAVGVGCALFGMYYFMSLYLQQVKGCSALVAGLAFLPSGLTSLSTSLLLRRLPAWIGPRVQLVCGPLSITASLVWLSRLTPDASYLPSVLGPLVLFGLGMGATFVPMTAVATADMPPHQTGLASALVNSSRQFGGAVGLAVMSTVAAAATRDAAAGVSHVQALTTGFSHALLVPAAASLAGVVVTVLLELRHGVRPPAVAPPVAALVAPVGAGGDADITVHRSRNVR
jgi:EmrB/QacA subfamily drug resistance transporter